MCTRRAVGTLLASALLALSTLPPETSAAEPHSNISLKVSSINGIGMVDYGGRPTFKVGDWVQYHVTGKSDLGVTDDYTVTLLIAGEEEFWGEPGFWVETWTQHRDSPPLANATLMSYDIFSDSLAIPHMQLYMRKTINELLPDGRPKQELYKRPPTTLTQRKPIANNIAWDVDTLDVVSVTVPKGTFQARKVHIEQGTGVEGQSPDSLAYTEVREKRMIYRALEVPVSHVALEEIEYGAWRKTWKTGYSREASPMNVMDRSFGRAELVGFGNGELEARMVPNAVRSSIAEQRRAARATSATSGARKKGTSGSR